MLTLSVAFLLPLKLFANTESSFLTLKNTALIAENTNTNAATTVPSSKKENTLRWYLGGKLGYSAIFVKDLTVTAPFAQGGKDTTLSSFAIGLNGGLRYTIVPKFHLRAELEYLYRTEAKGRYKNARYNFWEFTPPSTFNLKERTGNVSFEQSTHTILANLYFDYDITSIVSLYAGFGLGVSIIDAEFDAPEGFFDADNLPEPSASKTQANFAWQVGIGTRIAATKNVFVDINARYLGITGGLDKFGSPQLLQMKTKYNGAFELLVGVGYMF